MANAVLVSNPDSPYDDATDRYHFPKQYLTRVQQARGDNVVIYGKVVGKPGRYYRAVATVTNIRPDPNKTDHFYADLANYLDFDTPLHYQVDGGFESKLISPNGKVNGGTAQAAVRVISQMEFEKIVAAGFQDEADWPQRVGTDSVQPALIRDVPGFAEDAPLFVNRPTLSILSERKFRDRKFRHHVLNAYDRRCAFTGLRLINGGGRPEVEAAHIVPVEMNGSDSVRNGIALSGTAHWMFDRGLLSLADDFTILKSRHLNYDVDHLLNRTGKAILPDNPAFWPQRSNLEWHRSERFKN